MLLFFVSKIRLISNTESNYEDNKVDVVNMVKQNYNKNKTNCKIYWKTPARLFINRSCKIAKFRRTPVNGFFRKQKKLVYSFKRLYYWPNKCLAHQTRHCFFFADFESVFACAFDFESALGICMACPPKKNHLCDIKHIIIGK